MEKDDENFTCDFIGAPDNITWDKDLKFCRNRGILSMGGKVVNSITY